MNATDIIDAIQTGQCDDSLGLITAEVKARRAAKARSTSATLAIGDRVRLVGISPKYLNGVECTFQGHKNSKLTVQLDERIGKFGLGLLTVHSECVEAVSHDA